MACHKNANDMESIKGDEVGTRKKSLREQWRERKDRDRECNTPNSL